MSNRFSDVKITATNEIENELLKIETKCAQLKQHLKKELVEEYMLSYRVAPRLANLSTNFWDRVQLRETKCFIIQSIPFNNSFPFYFGVCNGYTILTLNEMMKYEH